MIFTALKCEIYVRLGPAGRAAAYDPRKMQFVLLCNALLGTADDGLRLTPVDPVDEKLQRNGM